MPKRKQKSNLKTNPVFIVGFFLVLIALFLKLHTYTKLSFANSPSLSTEEFVQDKPDLIISPKHGGELATYQTKIVNGIWEIHPDGISYVISGNYIFYGHNTSERFGFLSLVSVGDSLSLKFSSGQTRTFEVFDVKIVLPTETNELITSDPDSIVLYTCTGFADTKRLVVKAKVV